MLLSKFRERYGLRLQDLSDMLGRSPALLSLIERGKEPLPKYLALALPELGRQLQEKSKQLGSEQGCPHPQCGAPMHPQKNPWLKHWFYGRLKARVICSGLPGNPHKQIAMGIPYGKEKPIRLDRAINPHTGQEVPIPYRHRRQTYYERRWGDWAWCDAKLNRPDGCGYLLYPVGTYLHRGHYWNVFWCANKECRYYHRRLRCRGEKAVEMSKDLAPPQPPHSTLPEKAQHCPRENCGGITTRRTRRSLHRRLIQVHCKRCHRNSWYDTKLGKFVAPPKPGFGKADPHRPQCLGCLRELIAKLGPLAYRRKMRRMGLTYGGYKRRPARAPLPVQRKFEILGLLKKRYPPNKMLAIRYLCRRHRKDIWKTPDGALLWRRQRRSGPDVARNNHSKPLLS